MGYLDDKLGKGEKIVHRAHQHVFVLIRDAARWVATIVLALILMTVVLFLIKDQNFENTFKNIALAVTGVVVIISLIAFLYHYLQFMNEEYYITNERVIQVQGVLNKQELDSSLTKINDIQTFQSVFGRMFNYGRVQILTGNEAGINTIQFLSNPVEFKKKLQDAKNGIYGDASDLAPGQNQGRYYRDDEGDRRMRPPMPSAPQAPYPNNYPPQGNYPPVQGGYAGPEAYNPNYPPAVQINQADIPKMLQELGRLRDAGILTQQEFEAKKNELLRRL